MDVEQWNGGGSRVTIVKHCVELRCCVLEVFGLEETLSRQGSLHSSALHRLANASVFSEQSEMLAVGFQFQDRKTKREDAVEC